MAFQAKEMLRDKGKKFTFNEHPIELFIESKKIIEPFDKISSACWRGYVGHLKIEFSWLYLTNMKHRASTIKGIFKSSMHLFADRFSGELNSNKDDIFHYEYESLSESKIRFMIAKGLVVNCENI